MLIEITEPNKTSKKQINEVAAGIDLGTTRSLIAIKEQNKVEIIPQENNQNYILSAVTLENGIWKATNNPINALTSFKRFMGKNIKDFANDPIETRRIDKTSKDEIELIYNKEKITPIKLSSLILNKLINQASQHINKKINKAVITVPAYFDDTARASTLKAASLANIEVLRLLNEPTAAALAYGLDKKMEGTYLIYDLGGGTFDISILKMNDGVFKVIATNGNSKLGGDDIDYKIVDFLINKLKETHAQEVKSSNKYLEKILDISKRAKEQLTYDNLIDVNCDFEKFSLNYRFTRHEFEGLIKEIIAETILLVENTIQSSKITSQELDGIILIGGSTRIPAIKKELTKKFNIKIFDDINPDEAVARGAAIQAYNLTHGSDQLLIDVIPLSLGIEVMGGLNDKIIERNSTIPATVTKEFTTYSDGQTGMKFHIVQGERELVKDCRSLCKFEIDNLPPKIAGAIKIEVRFNIDANGILNITAQDKANNIFKEVEVHPTFGIEDNQINQMLEDSLKYAKEDVMLKLLTESIIKADQVITCIKKYLNEDHDVLTKKELIEINHQIKILEDSITKKDRNQIDKNLELLEKVTAAFITKRMDKYLQLNLKGKEISSVEKDLTSKE